MASRRPAGLTIAVLALAGALLTPAATTAAQPLDPEPIRIGGIYTLSGGPRSVPEIPATIQAVVDRVNDQGGVAGRPIEFLPRDDQVNPQVSAAVAQELVDAGVVAMVGSASFFDCSVNDALYRANDVLGVPFGVDPFCFETPVQAPTNTGAISGISLTLSYAKEQLGAERVCLLELYNPPALPIVNRGIERYEQNSGEPVTLTTSSLRQGEDPTPLLRRYQAVGCEAIILPCITPLAVSLLRAADAIGYRDVTFIDTGGCFREDLITTAGPLAEGWTSTSEYLPLSEDDPAINDFKQLAAENNLPVTAQALGAYLAANIVVAALESIDGEVTRQSTADALRALEYETSLLGEPFTFTNTRRSGIFAQVQDGRFTVVSDFLAPPPPVTVPGPDTPWDVLSSDGDDVDRRSWDVDIFTELVEHEPALLARLQDPLLLTTVLAPTDAGMRVLAARIGANPTGSDQAVADRIKRRLSADQLSDFLSAHLVDGRSANLIRYHDGVDLTALSGTGLTVRSIGRPPRFGFLDSEAARTPPSLILPRAENQTARTGVVHGIGWPLAVPSR
jgi:branched-chain amino acid transport system substrate-binding protein